MLKDITKLFVCGHSNRGCSETDACIHQSFRCAHDGPNKWCEAILMPTERVQHHVSDFSGYLQGLHNKVDTFVDEAILKDTMYFPILVEEFWHRENGKEHKCMMRQFHLETHDNNNKTDKKGMGNLVSGHCRDICFV